MNKEFTLSDLLNIILSKIKLILILGIIGALIAFVYVRYFTNPTYTCTGTMIVNPFSNLTGESSSSMINTEINISTRLLPTYIEVFTSRDLGEHLSKKLADQGIQVSGGQINEMTKYSTKEDSLIIRFECTSESREQAEAVAQAISKYSPEYIKKIIDHGSVSIVDSVGNAAKNSTSPYVMAMLAFMVVALIIVVISALIMVLDTRVKSGDDVTDRFEYPILGNIPNFYIENKAPTYER